MGSCLSKAGIIIPPTVEVTDIKFRGAGPISGVSVDAVLSVTNPNSGQLTCKTFTYKVVKKSDQTLLTEGNGKSFIAPGSNKVTEVVTPVNFALGVSYMFEHEKLGESTFSDSHRSDNNHRVSLYYTGSFAVSPLLSLVNTTYYQPRLDAFVDDYRLSTEVSLVVKLSKKLALKVAFNAFYDSEPPEGVKGLDTGTNVSIKLGL